MSGLRAAVGPGRLALVGGVVAAVVLGVGALAGWWRGGEAEPRAAPLRATATVAPLSALFGDALAARVSVLLDDRAVRPSSVSVATDFAPYSAAAPVVSRGVGRVTYTYRLVCLTEGCLPRKRGFTFRAATVRARTRAGTWLSAEATWPTVAVGTRLTAAEAAAARPAWHEQTGLAPVSWAIDPDLLAGLAAGGAIVLALAAGLLVARAVRSRAATLATAPTSTRSPLELALDRVRLAARAGSPSERRKALELLARVLRGAGDRELAARAMRLAWSSERPAPGRVESFADEVARQESGP